MDENKNANTTGGAAKPSQPVGSTTSGSEISNPAPKQKDVVEVPKSTLEKLLSRVEVLEKDNEILKEVADKDKLIRIEKLRAGGKLVKTVNLNVHHGKIVIGWSKVKDDVYFDEQGRLHEEQVILVHYLDGSKSEMDYRAFSRMKEPLKGEVISETKDSDGHTNIKVQLADGREINIDIVFVN